MPDRGNVNMVDFEGESGKTGYWTNQTLSSDTWYTTMGPLVAEIVATSCAGLKRATIVYDGGTATAGISGAYGNIEDKVRLCFSGNAGDTMEMDIPAPIADIFSADNETVDPTNAQIQALLAQLIALACTKLGQTIVALLWGKRVRKEHKG